MPNDINLKISKLLHFATSLYDESVIKISHAVLLHPSFHFVLSEKWRSDKVLLKNDFINKNPQVHRIIITVEDSCSYLLKRNEIERRKGEINRGIGYNVLIGVADAMS